MLSSFSDKISAGRMLMVCEFRIYSQKNEHNIIAIICNVDQIFVLYTVKMSASKKNKFLNKCF